MRARVLFTEDKSGAVLTRDPVERHPEVLVGAVGVLRPRQQVDGALVPHHKLHEGPGDGHVRRPEVEGDVVGRRRLAHECPQHERKERV